MIKKEKTKSNKSTTWVTWRVTGSKYTVMLHHYSSNFLQDCMYPETRRQRWTVEWIGGHRSQILLYRPWSKKATVVAACWKGLRYMWAILSLWPVSPQKSNKKSKKKQKTTAYIGNTHIISLYVRLWRINNSGGKTQRASVEYIYFRRLRRSSRTQNAAVYQHHWGGK